MHGPRSEARDLGHVDDVGPVVVGVVQHLRPRLRVRVREGGACVREREGGTERGGGKAEVQGRGERREEEGCSRSGRAAWPPCARAAVTVMAGLNRTSGREEAICHGHEQQA